MDLQGSERNAVTQHLNKGLRARRRGAMRWLQGGQYSCLLKFSSGEKWRHLTTRITQPILLLELGSPKGFNLNRTQPDQSTASHP